MEKFLLYAAQLCCSLTSCGCRRLFENFDVPREDPRRTRVEVSLSPGASINPDSGRPYPPFDSLSASATSLYLSSELSGSLLKSHTVDSGVLSRVPMTAKPRPRGRGSKFSFERSNSARGVTVSTGGKPPVSAADPFPPTMCDRENHLLGIVPCVPVSVPSLTLGAIEKLLLTAVSSVEEDEGIFSPMFS